MLKPVYQIVNISQKIEFHLPLQPVVTKNTP